MIQKKCKICERIIEGYTERHVEQLMDMHLLKHKRDVAREKEKLKDKEE